MKVYELVQILMEQEAGKNIVLAVQEDMDLDLEISHTENDPECLFLWINKNHNTTGEE